MKSLFILFGLMMAVTARLAAQTALWSKNSTESTSPTFSLHQSNLKKLLQTSPSESVLWKDKGAMYTEGTPIELPLPQGQLAIFYVFESPILAHPLQQKFPKIKTYRGFGADGKSTARLTFSPKGLNGTVMTKDGLIKIGPADSHSHATQYISYYGLRNALQNTRDENQPLENLNSPAYTQENFSINSLKEPRSSSNQSKVFQIALAATGEYTMYHGGTKIDAINAITTTLNTINAIYERELAIRFELVADNDLLIFTDSLSDPYTNGSSNLMIAENQDVINTTIGAGNYDIGHVLSTDGGGLAYLESVCTTLKAGGVSTSETPEGAFFDVAVVAHEIGHQFGAHHTQNNDCSRFANTAYEPASGSTIMSYAGTCEPNLQAAPDAYFHNISLEEILNFVESSANSCAQLINTGNQPPSISMPPSGFTIPKQTPFALEGAATDPNGDSLTYCWEQFDLEENGKTNTGSIFRSYPPRTSPIRRFPSLGGLIANSLPLGETLPTETGQLTFRLTVRDNHEGGGAFTYDETTVNVTANAGPFVVTSPNEPVSWLAGVPQLIEWNVANTKQSPVNCQSVHILLSRDGGYTFPDTLAASTENDGEEVIILPETNTDSARVKVIASDNIFFDINDGNFSISTAQSPGYVLSTYPQTQTLCAPSAGNFQLIATSLLGFDTPISLSISGIPENTQAIFSTTTLSPTDSAQITLETENATENGIYSLVFTGNANGTVQRDTVELNISVSPPEKPVLISPTDGQTAVSIRPEFNWQQVLGKTAYDLELSMTPDFSTIAHAVSALSQNRHRIGVQLQGNTRYYWRVKATNACGGGLFSAIDSFTTVQVSCNTYSSDQVPINISADGTSTVTSQISVENRAIITDINVSSLTVEHSYVSDLTVSLLSQSQTEALLFSEICGDNDQISLGLDSNSPFDTIACPPDDGRSYRPVGNLAMFNDSLSQGNWTLLIEDRYNLDGGSLNGWSLQICTIPLPFNLKALALAPDQIAINWDDVVDDEQNFIVERTVGNSTAFIPIDTLNANNNIFIDDSLASRTLYRYRLRILYLDGGFSLSNIATTTTMPEIPKPPSELEGQAVSQTRINLNWQDNSQTETGFLLERSINDSTSFQLIDSLEANTLFVRDTALIASTTYFYRVRAYNQSGASAYSPTLSVTTLPTIPAMASELEVTLTAYDQVALRWKNNADNATYFKIERAKEEKTEYISVALVSGETTQFIDVDLAPSTEYRYRIRAGNEGGESDPTPSVTILTLPAPPPAPQNLVGNVVSLNSISLRWADRSATETGFIIEKSIGNGNAFQILDTVEADLTSFLDTGLLTNSAYFYRVKSFNAGGESEYSNVLSIAIFPSAPNAPSLLRDTDITQSAVNLSWLDNSNNELGFYLERKTDDSATFSRIDTLLPNQNSFLDTALSSSTPYFYRVNAFNSSGESGFSNELEVKTLPRVPGAPSNLVLEKVSSTQINLFWVDNSDNENKFVIERAEGDGIFEEVATTVADRTVFSDVGLANNADYFYRVAAQNEGGQSEYSNQTSTLTVGLESKNPFPFSLYPNPVEEACHLIIPEDVKGLLKITLVDALGMQRWYKQENASLLAQEGILKINMGKLPSGPYHLLISHDGKLSVIKIIKQ